MSPTNAIRSRLTLLFLGASLLLGLGATAGAAAADRAQASTSSGAR